MIKYTLLEGLLSKNYKMFGLMLWTEKMVLSLQNLNSQSPLNFFDSWIHPQEFLNFCMEYCEYMLGFGSHLQDLSLCCIRYTGAALSLSFCIINIKLIVTSFRQCVLNKIEISMSWYSVYCLFFSDVSLGTE